MAVVPGERQLKDGQDSLEVKFESAEMDGVKPQRESENVYSAEIVFADLSLLPGSYVLKAHPLDSEGVRLFDTLERGLTIRGESREFGLVRLNHTWGAP